MGVLTTSTQKVWYLSAFEKVYLYPFKPILTTFNLFGGKEKVKDVVGTCISVSHPQLELVNRFGHLSKTHRAGLKRLSLWLSSLVLQG